jgi:hypothetical protein
VDKNKAQLKSLDVQRKNRQQKMENYQDQIEGVNVDIKNLHRRAQERKKKVIIHEREFLIFCLDGGVKTTN